jgi:cell wall-associated NlpC family hydrolase
MFPHAPLRITVVALAFGLAAVSGVRADDEAPAVVQEQPTLLEQASSSIGTTLDKALDLLGVRYRWGGTRPETGFDCSGFVAHVFREGLGLDLPRSARAMSLTGEKVDRDELQPGDLVFFNTMRRAFSHVGIYLGDNLFVHAPHRGAAVRVEDMSARYWIKRFSGARRVAAE